MQVFYFLVSTQIFVLGHKFCFWNTTSCVTQHNLILSQYQLLNKAFLRNPNEHKLLHHMTDMFPPKMLCLKKKPRSWTMSKIILTFMNANIRLFFTCIHCLSCTKFWNLIKNHTKIVQNNNILHQTLSTNALNIKMIYFITYNPSKFECFDLSYIVF